jgi:hypothetical protein
MCSRGDLAKPSELDSLAVIALAVGSLPVDPVQFARNRAVALRQHWLDHTAEARYVVLGLK